MFNGLADSVTTLTKQPKNAAKWVKFLSGQQCQDIIGSSGVVFPTQPQGTDLAIKYNKTSRDLDVTPFTEQVKSKTTFLFPVTTNAADIVALTYPAFDAIYIGSRPSARSPTSTTRFAPNLLCDIRYASGSSVCKPGIWTSGSGSQTSTTGAPPTSETSTSSRLGSC